MNIQTIYWAVAIIAGLFVIFEKIPKAALFTRETWSAARAFVRDIPRRWQARKLTRETARSLRENARALGLSEDDVARKLRHPNRRDFLRSARRTHYMKLKDPSLGLDRN